MPTPLGDAIRNLLKTRELKAFQLGEQIGLSPTSVSKIMNGVSRPRQNTFSRMCEVLCTTKEEEQLLVSAFAGADALEEEPTTPLPDDKAIERERAERFLEVKTQSIQFKRSVARELDKAGIAYQQDYCEGPYSTDFLVEKDGQRIALECKANVSRDKEKSFAMAQLLQAGLSCDRVLIVVPYLEDGAPAGIVCVTDIVSLLST